MEDILSEIIANKRKEVDLQKQAISIEQLSEGIGDLLPTRSMKQAIASSPTGIIAEFKRRSPSKGWIKENGVIFMSFKGYPLTPYETSNTSIKKQKELGDIVEGNMDADGTKNRGSHVEPDVKTDRIEPHVHTMTEKPYRQYGNEQSTH